jgi:predicted ribosome quality control (RQC) complex YloA/Tae2 family protein
MLSNYYTLAYIASTLDSTIRGWEIEALYTQNRDEIIVRFAGKDEHLVVLCVPEGPILYLRGGLVRAKRNSMDLLPGACGKTIAEVRIRPADRIIFLPLTGGRSLAALLFGTKSNLLLLDSDGMVADAFKGGKKLTGTSLELRDGELLHDFTAFRQGAPTARAGSAVAFVKRSFPVLGGTLVAEAFHRSGISPSLGVEALAGPVLDALEGALHAVLGDLSRPAPRLYVRDDGVPALFSIIALSHATGTERRYDSVHEAVQVFLSRRGAASARDDAKSGVTSVLRQKIAKLRRTRQAIADDVEAAQRAADYERFAGFLMGRLAGAARGEKSAEMETDSGIERIPLDPALSPVQNAQRYFEKAKRSRAAITGAAGRVPELDERIARGEELLAAADRCGTRDELKAFMAENAKELDGFGLGEKTKEREELPFRIFVVDGGFEVWAGKSSANNDLLTLRHAKPDDLWFHARGASGSHVVLKVGTGKGEPGKKAREQAAGIAAYYSRMKNAKMVPVAVTEKRYVRKPKGAPPGTVVIEREKVIFAEPALPPHHP